MKKVAVYYLGEKLRDIYPHATRWQVIKYRARMAFRRFLVGAVMFAMLAGAYGIGSARADVAYVRGESIVTTIDNGPETIAKAKAVFLSELAACESPNYKAGDDAIIMDTNDKISVGPFKFQVTTMQQYYKELNGEELTPSGAVAAAMDYDTAAAVASYVWFVKGKGPREWVNCTKWHSLDDKAAFISAMEK